MQENLPECDVEEKLREESQSRVVLCRGRENEGKTYLDLGDHAKRLEKIYRSAIMWIGSWCCL